MGHALAHGKESQGPGAGTPGTIGFAFPVCDLPAIHSGEIGQALRTILAQDHRVLHSSTAHAGLHQSNLEAEGLILLEHIVAVGADGHGV